MLVTLFECVMHIETISVTDFELERYLALVVKYPDSSCNLNGKYDKQEEEELYRGRTKLNSADCVTVCLHSRVCMSFACMCEQVRSFQYSSTLFTWTPPPPERFSARRLGPDRAGEREGGGQRLQRNLETVALILFNKQ